MKIGNFKAIRAIVGLIAIIALGPLMSPLSQAALSLPDKPLFVSAPVPPMAMLDVTRDHQLYYKAYNDFSDLDGDGVIETTYKHSFDYAGYFDSYKCYNYDTASTRFVPIATNTDKYCSGAWSGNFLNWVAMSRIDIVRKVLYGGLRSTDLSSVTVLERTYLPTDAHSWAKYYDGADVAQLTPFTALTAAQTYSSASSLTLNSSLFVPRTVTAALTNSGTTATATRTAHGFTTGQQVLISGATASQYNGIFTITVTAANKFTYTMTSDPGGGGGASATIALVAQTTVSGSGYPLAVGDQVSLSADSSNYATGVVVQLYTSPSSAAVDVITSGTAYVVLGDASKKISPVVVGSGTYSTWTLSILNSTGISFCNTTWAASSQVSTTLNTALYPPLIRAARGNFALWAANEGLQCYWGNEGHNNTQNGFSGGFRSNGNRYLRSGLAASAENPDPAAHGLVVPLMTGKADYNARVEVCNSTLLGKENCKQYPGGNWKPVGLLQRYGEPATAGAVPKIRFGLMTGSYAKNISGGVLRKAIGLPTDTYKGSMEDEINFTTDGTFKNPTYGIVKTMDKLRMYGYEYSSGTYISKDGCNYQQIGIKSIGGSTSQGDPAIEGNCSSWGDPLSEIYLESLRYLAGKPNGTSAQTPNFSYTDAGSKDNALGLKQAAWNNPLTSDNYCSPLNVVVFNASASSFDADQMGGFADLTPSGATLVPTACTDAFTCTKLVGDGEGITGGGTPKTVLAGGTDVVAADGLCSGKAVNDLSAVRGICPEAASLEGGYLISGLAYYAHLNQIRNKPTLPAADKRSYKVTTYGVQLATNVPRIAVDVGGKQIIIQPAYRLDRTDKAPLRYGTGTIVDFRVISKTATSGLFYVNWEDSNQGGDYDQDVIGIIRYDVVGASTITITTQVTAASSGYPQGFGYIVSGTTQDGPHFHSGIYGFNYTDGKTISVSPTTNVNLSGGCSSCNDDSASVARTATYTVGSATDIALNDPLYYAAKWGGFVDGDADNKPSATSEWDAKKVDGTLGVDGQPDTYFYVNNPGALENALNNAFLAIVSSSAASAVATNSSQLRTGATIYQAIFNPLNWTGQLVAYGVNPTTGALITPPQWDAGVGPVPTNSLKKPDANARVIMTYKRSSWTGATFRWADMDASQQAAIQAADTVTVAQARVDYLRGDDGNEGLTAGKFRERPVTKLGDISASNPQYVGTPEGQYGSEFSFFDAYNKPSFLTFRNAHKTTTRPAMLYVGANDGMLHGFDASTGEEKLGFVPRAIYANLPSLSSQSYTHKFFVDGSPQAADVEWTTDVWKTLLVGGLNAGGRGIYALDVTDITAFSETAPNPANVVLWEFTNLDDSDLGYTYGDPLIVKMNNGKWAAVFGNGYNSDSARAKLFIVYLKKTSPYSAWTATDYVKLDTGVGDAASINGLSGVNAMDMDGNGTVDFLYAGDLQGNVWKFDVSDVDSTNWDIASIKTLETDVSGIKQPLFVACVDTTSPCPAAKRQPIITRLEVAFHPTFSDTAMVYVGTGRYLVSSDELDTTVQTFYGVWDKGVRYARSDLLVRSFTDSADTLTRTVAGSGIDWSSTGKKGWLIDLKDPAKAAAGERVTGRPTLINGFVYFNTLIPSSSACDFGGSGYLMGLNFADGSQSTKPIWDTTGDGKVDASDGIIAGTKVGAVLGGTTIIRPGIPLGIAVGFSNPTKPEGSGGTSGGGTGGTGGTGTVDTKPSGVVMSLPGSGGSRISWRELTPE